MDLTHSQADNKQNDYVRAAECDRRGNQLHMSTVQLQDRINFYKLINDLQKRGYSVEAVKRIEEMAR